MLTDLNISDAFEFRPSNAAEPEMGPLGFRFEKLTRVLLPRRLSGWAQLDGEPVFAKVFAAGPRGQERAEREQSAHQQLVALGILAPKLVHVGSLCPSPIEGAKDPGPSPTLIFERLHPTFDLTRLKPAARNLGVFADPRDPAAWEQLKSLLNLVADLHRKGVRQKDLHLGNFMSTERGLCALDHGSLLFDQSIGAKQREQDIAALLVELDPSWLAYRDDLCSAYTHRSGVALSSVAIQQHAQQRWEDRRRNFAKKVQRNSSATTIFRAANGRLALNRNEGPFSREQTENLVDSLRSSARKSRQSATVRSRLEWGDHTHRLEFSKGVFREAHARTMWIDARQLEHWGLPVLRASFLRSRFPRRPIVGFRSATPGDTTTESGAPLDTESSRRSLGQALAKFDHFGCRLESLAMSAVMASPAGIELDSAALSIRWQTAFHDAGPCPRIQGLSPDHQSDVAAAFASARDAMRSKAASIKP